MAILRMIRGHDPGRVYVLKSGNNTLGRDADCCDIVLAHNAVSRIHATIELQGDVGYIEDHSSRNGTIVNGQSLSPGRDGRRLLGNSDWIEIDGFCLAFEDDPSSESTALMNADETGAQPTIHSKISVSTGSDDPQLQQHAETKLRTVLGIIEDLSDAIELKDVLPRLLDALLKTFDKARVGCVLIRDSVSDEFVPTVIRRSDGKKDSLQISRTVVDYVAENKAVILSDDVRNDDRFQAADSVNRMPLRSVMGGPLLDKRATAIGVIQLFGDAGRKRFDQDDLDVFASIIRHISIVVENSRLHDTTVRKQRSQLEQRFQNLIEGSIQGVLVHRNAKPLFVNEAYATLFGYTVEELLAMPSVLPLVAPDDAERLTGYMRARMAGKEAPERYDFQAVRRDGSVIWLENVVTLVEWGSTLAIQSTVVDITERKRAESELRQSESKFRTLAESTAAGIFMWRDSKYVSVNAAMERITGYSRDELLRMNFWELVHPEHQQMVRERGLARVHGERLPSRYEVKLLTKDGDVRWIDLTAAVTGPDNKTVLGTAFDITERKRAEQQLREAHAELEQRVEQRTAELARSNKDLEDFAYVVSHDLQVPLRSVKGYCQVLKRRWEERLDEEANEFIDLAVGGAQRMEKLIRDLLRLSRVSTRAKPMQLAAVGEIVGEVLQNLAAAIDETGATVTHDKLPSVLADATQLGQVFQNLVENAIKFRGDQTPRIQISAQQQDGQWLFSVRDNGIGVAPDHAERIFQVFQRLHGQNEYPGTGIGLAICKRVIERHGGRIWLESKPGEGSVFHFTLPIAK